MKKAITLRGGEGWAEIIVQQSQFIPGTQNESLKPFLVNWVPLDHCQPTCD